MMWFIAIGVTLESPTVASNFEMARFSELATGDVLDERGIPIDH
jgi:hypothetical protein